MAPTKHFILLSLVLAFCLLQTPTFAIKKSYIVYLGAHSHGPHATSADYDRATDNHHNFLGSFLGSKEKAKDEIYYSYQKHVNGFAATLEEKEAMEISKHPDVISVFLAKQRKLRTTHSWEFMGLERDGRIPEESIWSRANFGKDVIIAHLDTGVWPESESFNDEGMGPVPSRWKGFCQNNTEEGVPCNRKLIGARYFKEGYENDSKQRINSTFLTARDFEGHGSHTLSTAGGRFVPNANFFGQANGTAKGGCPAARVASYKACWNSGCHDADILAGIDAAINDGVDVLSLSLGGYSSSYITDAPAIVTFHAVMNGISVVCSAGNSGPTESSVENEAPWILTVAASSIDRAFPSYVKLGNNQQFEGVSLSPDVLPEKMYPLINSLNAGRSNSTLQAAHFCAEGALDPEKVKGKIVFCTYGEVSALSMGLEVRAAGGVGMIVANDDFFWDDVTPEGHFLPATNIRYLDGMKVFLYLEATESPVAYITPRATVYGRKPNPQVASFSSRGPNHLTPQILKPDVTAPGRNILAAYSQYVPATDLGSDPRRVRFNILSGTSMSAPHVAGVVGLLKSLHPDWSSAAIRSAIMTTSRSRDNAMEPMPEEGNNYKKATPFAYGAGHIRPNRAMDPGLVYDLTTDDYLDWLCAIGYNTTRQMDVFAKHKCPSTPINILNFNYPSITVPELTDATIVRRKVKNVGPPSTYTATVHHPPGVSVYVEPQTLKFEKTGEEKSFKIVLWPKYYLLKEYVFGKLTWSDGVHHVRSPIVVASSPVVN